MALPSTIDQSRVVEVNLGGAVRPLCFPIGAVEHFMAQTGENPCHIALAKLHTIEFLSDGPGKSVPMRFANPHWVIAFLHSGLITDEPTLDRTWVEDAIAKAIDETEGATLLSVCNALAAVLMLALHRWHIINVPGLDKRERAKPADRPTRAARGRKTTAPTSTATSTGSTEPATAVG